MKRKASAVTQPGGMKTAIDKRQNRDAEIQAGSMVDVTCGSFGCGRLAKKMRAGMFIPDDCDPEIGSAAACLVGLRIWLWFILLGLFFLLCSKRWCAISAMLSFCR